MNNRFTTFAAVLLLIFSGMQGSRAQEASSNAAPTPDVNPESDTGALKAQVTTGGSYDAHSGNATRIVNDLQVPDALGDYGLDFTRYWNSLHNEDTNPAAEWPLDFGFSGWSHSWRWSATYDEVDLHDPEVTNLIDYETSITITFPDGHATKFKIVRTNYGPGAGTLRFGPPYDDQPIDWPIPGPHAHDRLVDMDPNGLQFWLSRADGGSVHFVAVGSNPGNPRWLYYQADKVYDSHGFLTELFYDNEGYLRQVKQEGNRWLTINWKRPVDYNILLIESVETGGNAGSQRVAYKYRKVGGQNGLGGNYVLTFVDYDESIPGHTTSARYTYGHCYGETEQCSGLDRSSFPLLKAADDPHYSGAMTKIRYNYYGTACPIRNYPPPSPPPGYYDWFYFTPTAVTRERSGETGAIVSQFEPECYTGIRTDKNGIGGWRRFYYGSSGRDSDLQYPGICMGYDLLKLTDFAMGEALVDSVPRRRQNGAEPTMTIDGAGVKTYPLFGDGSGNPSYIGFDDGSNCTYNRTNPNTSPPSATPDSARINNKQHHWLFSAKDERDQFTIYRRDGRRRVTDIKYHDNSTEQFEYNDLNQVKSHKLPSLAVKTYEYNALHRLQLVHNTVDRSVDGEMADKFYEYDTFGRVFRVTEGRARSNGAHTVTMLYNRRHQVTSVAYPSTGGASAPTVWYEYDRYGNCTKIKDELNNERTYTYDAYRRCTSYTEPVNDGCGTGSRTWNWIYDRVIVDEENQQIGHYPASAHTSKEWRIQIEPIFNANNERRATDRTFDVKNRIIAERTGLIQMLGSELGTLTVVPSTTEEHRFSYDGNGQKSSYTDPLGRRTEYEYDDRNRLKISTEYPTAVSEDTGPPRVTETHYDRTGNKIWLKFPDGEIQEWPNYSPFGQPLQFKDERGHFTYLTYQWGPMKKLHTVTTHRTKDNSSGGGTEHQLTTFTYDEMGRSKKVIFPDETEEITTYQYGQIHTWKTRRNQLKTITLYDKRGRELQHTWSDGAAPAINRVWDDANRLKYIANSFASIDYQHDDAGRITKERIFVVGTNAWKELSYCHYPSGEVSTITYPDQTVISRFYTARGQLQSVGWGTGATSYEYLADGKVSFQSYTNQMRTDYGYNGRGFISSVRHWKTPNGLDLAYREYWRDDRDRIEAWKRGTLQSQNVMEDGRGDRYHYDPEGQLTSADYRAERPNEDAATPFRRDSFQYDELGNRMHTNRVASKGVMDIVRRDNGLNQYESWETDDPGSGAPHWGSGIFFDDNFPAPSGPSAPWRWVYPGNGVTMGDGWITASYNALNQPVAIWSFAYSGTPNFMWFGYDPLGRCVKRWEAPLTADDQPPPLNTNPATYYYYDGWNLVHEFSTGATNAARRYVHGGRVDEIVASFAASSNQWAFHHYDARGHCILLTDIDRNIIEQYDYDVFGQPYCYTGGGAWLSVDGRPGSPWGNRFLFTGREWLDDLKIYDFRNRMYQPELGRFLQPDPKQFEAGDYNLYRYCHNDPINKTDPTGLIGESGTWNSETMGLGIEMPQGYLTATAVVATPMLIAAGAEAGSIVLAARAALLVRAAVPLTTAAKLTQHGAERVEGAAATRGGVLSQSAARLVQETGTRLTQADGAAVHVAKTEAGRYNVVVSGQRGIITTFKNLTEKKYEKLAERYGYKK